MFNRYPVNPVRSPLPYTLKIGFQPVSEELLDYCLHSERDTFLFCVDGTNGADFYSVVLHIRRLFSQNGFIVGICSTSDYLKSPSRLQEHFRDNITDNRAFGYVTEGDISDYFIADARHMVENEYREFSGSDTESKKLFILYGPGAWWLSGQKGDRLLFLDVSREYQQIHYKKGLPNFGMNRNSDFVIQYKIAYFVEWPILEKYRKQLLEQIDIYVDMNHPEQPVSIEGKGLKEIILDIAGYPLRVKPFYFPGVWGGQRLKELAGLPEKDFVNCAWQYEPIAPENSLLIGLGDATIEVPFLIVMALAHQKIMGERTVRLFGDYFPIRFDYLDTMDGDNLSVQVHPKQEYVKKHFHEKLEQQESYYIMEKKGPAKVYLGLTENCTKEEFLEKIRTAQETGVPFPYKEYVNEFDTEKGNLYLIPPGTVHCSGKNNLVLEISSTTWWFTFKIYDYLRKDLDGKPRPVNIDHGFANIDFYKKTEWVKENLMPEPVLIGRQGENEEYLLGQREDLLFTVKRIHLIDEWKEHTRGEFVLYNLVEGERVRIVSCRDDSIFVDLNYAESYIVPASFGEYKLVNLGPESCKLVKAELSPDWKVKIIED